MSERYRPSNGTEGMGFYENWCSRCRHDRPEDEDGGCDILRRTFAFQVADEQYPDEWTYDEGGSSCCTAFEEAGKEDSE